MAAEDGVVEAVFRAAREGDVGIVAGMLDEDPRLLTFVWRNGSLLHTAAWYGHVDLMRLLLERGAEINQANKNGNTAFHFAVSRGHEEVVSMLLSSGADPSRRGLRGQMALMLASRNGHVALVRLLLRSMGGRGLDERDMDGRTALWWACIHGNDDVVRVLLLAGADHTISDDFNRTPLQAAEMVEHYQCVALIQVSTSLVSCSKGHRYGTVSAVCDAHVVRGRTSQSVPVLQWWEGELHRAYVLHKARTLHEDTATRQQAPAAPVPAYLTARVTPGSVLPSMQVVAIDEAGEEGAAKREREEGGQAKEEEVFAMVGFVVRDLDGHLYTELLEGLKLR
jgi:hypothetical protein